MKIDTSFIFEVGLKLRTALRPVLKYSLLPILALMLIAALMTGCTSSETESTGARSSEHSPAVKLKVVTTVFPAFDFTRQIAGDTAEISLLLPPGTESHSFEPTPADIVAIADCDLFIYVGGESDTWVDAILESLDSDAPQVIKLMDCVQVVEEETVEGMQVTPESDADSNEDTDAKEYDEHVWTSPRNAMLITKAISARLCELDPINAATFEEGRDSYLKQLDALDVKFREVVDGAKRKTLIFADRFPFRYFVDAYGLDYYAAFPGCSAESEVNPRTVAFLIDKVQAEQIPVVLKIELTSQGIADTISEDSGAQVLTLHSVHNVSKDEMNNGATYLSLMESNVEVLRKALN